MSRNLKDNPPPYDNDRVMLLTLNDKEYVGYYIHDELSGMLNSDWNIYSLIEANDGQFNGVSADEKSVSNNYFVSHESLNLKNSNKKNTGVFDGDDIKTEILEKEFWPELDGNNDKLINSMVEAADWFVVEKEFEKWNNRDINNIVEPEFHGYFYMGNDMYDFSVTGRDIKISKTVPLEADYSNSAQVLHPFFPERHSWKLYENNCEETDVVVLENTGNSLEQLQKNMIRDLLDKGLIKPLLLPEYKYLKYIGLSYIKQIDARHKQLDEVDNLRAGCPRELITKKEKLSTLEFSAIRDYYAEVSRHLYQKNGTATENGRMLIKEMINNGLNVNRINMVCKDNNIEFFGIFYPEGIGKPPAEILKEPEIRELYKACSIRRDRPVNVIQR